jgi:hypothetical protein
VYIPIYIKDAGPDGLGISSKYLCVKLLECDSMAVPLGWAALESTYPCAHNGGIEDLPNAPYILFKFMLSNPVFTQRTLIRYMVSQVLHQSNYHQVFCDHDVEITPLDVDYDAELIVRCNIKDVMRVPAIKGVPIGTSYAVSDLDIASHDEWKTAYGKMDIWLLKLYFCFISDSDTNVLSYNLFSAGVVGRVKTSIRTIMVKLFETSSPNGLGLFGTIATTLSLEYTKYQGPPVSPYDVHHDGSYLPIFNEPTDEEDEHDYVEIKWRYIYDAVEHSTEETHNLLSSTPDTVMICNVIVLTVTPSGGYNQFAYKTRDIGTYCPPYITEIIAKRAAIPGKDAYLDDATYDLIKHKTPMLEGRVLGIAVFGGAAVEGSCISPYQITKAVIYVIYALAFDQYVLDAKIKDGTLSNEIAKLNPVTVMHFVFHIMGNRVHIARQGKIKAEVYFKEASAIDDDRTKHDAEEFIRIKDEDVTGLITRYISQTDGIIDGSLIPNHIAHLILKAHHEYARAMHEWRGNPRKDSLLSPSDGYYIKLRSAHSGDGGPDKDVSTGGSGGALVGGGGGGSNQSHSKTSKPPSLQSGTYGNSSSISGSDGGSEVESVDGVINYVSLDCSSGGFMLALEHIPDDDVWGIPEDEKYQKFSERLDRYPGMTSKSRGLESFISPPYIGPADDVLTVQIRGKDGTTNNSILLENCQAILYNGRYATYGTIRHQFPRIRGMLFSQDVASWFTKLCTTVLDFSMVTSDL